MKIKSEKLASGMILIGLVGAKRSGKDTVADRLVAEHGFTKVAFADPLKEMALALDPIVHTEWEDYGVDEYRLSEVVTGLGWEGAKEYPEVRRTLQRLGTEVIRNHVGTDYWIERMDRRLLRMAVRGVGVERVVITDCRFPNEAGLVHTWGGCLVRVERPALAQVDSHASESIWRTAPFDHALSNTHDIPHLHAQVDRLVGVINRRRNAA